MKNKGENRRLNTSLLRSVFAFEIYIVLKNLKTLGKNKTICSLKAELIGNAYFVFIYHQFKTNYSNLRNYMQIVKKIK